MANSLTGAVDLVVQMPARRLDRVLAALHQQEAFPHSFVLAIDDGTAADATRGPIRVDAARTAFIHAIREARVVAGPQVQARAAVRATAIASALGRARAVDVVHWADGPWPKTGVRCTAEVQASTPTVTLPPVAGGGRVTVTFRVMAHLRLDPASTPLPDFLHGDVELEFEIAQLATQDGNRLAIDFSAIDFLGFDAQLRFIPADGVDSSQWPTATIEQVIINVLAFGFVSPCRTIDVPAAVKGLRLRMLPVGAPPAAALLVDMTAGSVTDAAADSVTSTFVGANDDYAIAVGRDYLVPMMNQQAAAELGAFVEAMRKQQAKQAPDGALPADQLEGAYRVTFPVCTRPRLDVTYEISFPSPPAIELELGAIRLSAQIHAERKEAGIFWRPIPGEVIDFTIVQRIRLKVVDGTVEVDEVLDDPEIAPPDVFAKDELLNAAKGWRGGLLEPLRAQLRALVGQFDLAVLLRSLGLQTATTAYHAVEVRYDGIVLRGTIAIPLRGPVAVTDAVPFEDGGRKCFLLNAFPSWIPGGTVDSYTWTRVPSLPMPVRESHRFMSEVDDDSVGPASWCLEMTGSRIGASGYPQPARLFVCRAVVPSYGLLPFSARRVVAVGGTGAGIDAYVDPWSAGVASAHASTLVHFTDSTTPAAVRVLHELRSRTSDLAFAIVVVSPHDRDRRREPHEANAGPILFTEDFEQGWSHTFAVGERPATYLVDRTGRVCWHRMGPLELDELLTVAREQRIAHGPVARYPMRIGVAEGQPAPDFHFEVEGDRRIRLQQLRGRPVVLVFWTSWAEPSVALLRELGRVHGDPPPVVLAIADGDEPSVARAAFERIGSRARLVPDPGRALARAYKVHCWPTAIWVDPDGRVERIQMGLGRHHRESRADGAPGAA